MALDVQPTLTGPTLTLRPLRAEDADALYEVGGDPLVWEQHPARNRHEREVFQAYIDDGVASGGALLVTEGGRAIGTSRYHGYDPQARTVEIGWTFLARSHWGGSTNRELKQLMLDHAFTEVDTVLFRVGAQNMRSRTAVGKLGARLRAETPDAEGNVVFELPREVWQARRAG